MIYGRNIIQPRFRTQTALSRGETPGPESSIGKIISANTMMDMASTALDATYSNHAVQVRDIVRTTIETADGETIVMPGYLDVGLVDTIKDMMVNFVGAVVFSTIGFFYVKHRGKGRIASQFIPTPDPEPEHGKDENRREEKG